MRKVIGHGTGFFATYTALSPTPVKSNFPQPRLTPLSSEPKWTMSRTREPAAAGLSECRMLQSLPPASPGPSDTATNAITMLLWQHRGHWGELPFWPTTKEKQNAERGANLEAAVSPFLLHLSHLPKQDPFLLGIRWITPVFYSGILRPLYNDTVK